MPVEFGMPTLWWDTRSWRVNRRREVASQRYEPIVSTWVAMVSSRRGCAVDERPVVVHRDVIPGGQGGRRGTESVVVCLSEAPVGGLLYSVLNGAGDCLESVARAPLRRLGSGCGLTAVTPRPHGGEGSGHIVTVERSVVTGVGGGNPLCVCREPVSDGYLGQVGL